MSRPIRLIENTQTTSYCLSPRPMLQDILKKILFGEIFHIHKIIKTICITILFQKHL